MLSKTEIDWEGILGKIIFGVVFSATFCFLTGTWDTDVQLWFLPKIKLHILLAGIFGNLYETRIIHKFDVRNLLKERERYTEFSLYNQGYCQALKDILGED